MTINHALFFRWNNPKPGMEGQSMELFNASQEFWKKAQADGEIEHAHTVMLAAVGNHDLSGFTVVMGDRAKLHKLRWENNNFLKLHMGLINCIDGYGCIDGIAGEALDQLMGRWMESMKKD